MFPSHDQDIKAEQVSAQQLVQQYRKNNASLSELFDPTLSRAANRAKKDVLLDFNRAIAKTIQEKFPDTNFSKLFDFTNKRWTEIKDAEFIDKFMGDLFKGEIKYEKGKSFLQSENAQLPFKRMLGKEGYQHFEQLTKDLLSTEQANRMLKVAEAKGLSDYAKYALNFVIHPSIAKAKIGVDLVKNAWEGLLDKPRLSLKWDEGVNQFKKGDFKAASKTFKTVEKELNIPREDVEVLAAEKVAEMPKDETIEGKAERIIEEPEGIEHKLKDRKAEGLKKFREKQAKKTKEDLSSIGYI